MKTQVMVLVIVLAIGFPSVQAQEGTTFFTEDFEDDATAPPSDDWYDFQSTTSNGSACTGSGGGGSQAIISSGGSDGGKYFQSNSGPSPGSGFRFSCFQGKNPLDLCESGGVSFYFTAGGGGSTRRAYALGFTQDGLGINEHSFGVIVSGTNTIGYVLRILDGQGSNVEVVSFVSTASGWEQAILTPNCVTGEHTVEVVGKFTKTFTTGEGARPHSGSTGLHLWMGGAFTGGSTAATTTEIDQIDTGMVFSEGGDVVGGGGSEFDSGLRAFAASAGFISQESQLFFSLILIGLVTVTTSGSSKWVAPGRFKNYLLMGAQVLVAVFCVIAAFLDLWMFLVAFMVGLFAVRGSQEARNTWFEMQEALARRNAPDDAVELESLSPDLFDVSVEVKDSSLADGLNRTNEARRREQEESAGEAPERAAEREE